MLCLSLCLSPIPVLMLISFWPFVWLCGSLLFFTFVSVCCLLLGDCWCISYKKESLTLLSYLYFIFFYIFSLLLSLPFLKKFLLEWPFFLFFSLFRKLFKNYTCAYTVLIKPTPIPFTSVSPPSCQSPINHYCLQISCVPPTTESLQCCQYVHGCRTIWWISNWNTGKSFRSHILEEISPFPRSHQLPIVSQLRAGLCNFFSFHAEILTAWFYADLVHVVTVTLSSYVYLSCSHPLTMALAVFCLFSHDSWVLGGGPW